MNRLIASLFSLALLAYLIVNPAMAAGYIGVSIGSADIEGTDDTSSKIFVGYRQGNVGFEAAHHDLGKQEESAGAITASIEVSGIELSGAGFMPVSPTFDLFGKIGLLMWDADLFLTGFPPVASDGTDLIFGIGAQFIPSNNISVRFEYQLTTLDVEGVDFDTDVISIGVAFNF